MAQVINTNMSSLNAQRNLSRTQADLATSLQRLSTGLRINSAKDDAAGLAISERFTTQIRGFNQAVRNANDAISLSQTAEGAMVEITNNLQRIRELATQSANATNSASDRQALNAEVQQLISEIGRVSSQTKFNGVALLDGTFSSQVFQVGANVGDTITISSIANASTGVLGGTSTTTYSATTLAGGGAPTAALSAGDLVINGEDVGAVSQDARLIANAVNTKSGLTNVTASVSSSTTGALGAFGHVDVDTSGGGTYTLSVGGVSLVNQAVTATATSASLGAFTDVTSVTANDTYTLQIDGNTVIQSVDLSTDTVTAAEMQTAINNFVAANSEYSIAAGTVAGGDLQIAKDDGSLLSITEVLGGSTPLGGFATLDDSGVPTQANPVYNVDIDGAYIDTQVAANASALASAGITYTGTAAAGTLNFSKADGSNLVVNETFGAGLDNTTGYATAANGTNRGTITLNGTGVDGITITGTNPQRAGASITAGNSQTSTATVNVSGNVGAIDISSVSGANAALTIVDNALTQINGSRADLGAYQNRFASTIANLQTASENLSAARSRIQDADFGAETANLTRAQILQQAGVAMLAQANVLPQTVLALLQ